MIDDDATMFVRLTVAESETEQPVCRWDYMGRTHTNHDFLKDIIFFDYEKDNSTTVWNY